MGGRNYSPYTTFGDDPTVLVGLSAIGKSGFGLPVIQEFCG